MVAEYIHSERYCACKRVKLVCLCYLLNLDFTSPDEADPLKSSALALV